MLDIPFGYSVQVPCKVLENADWEFISGASEIRFGVYGLWNSWKLNNAKYEKNGGNA